MSTIGASKASSGGRTRALLRHAPALGGVAAAVLGGATWAIAQCGSLPNALDYMAGSRVVVEPRAATVAEGKHGESREIAVLLRNLADRPVRVLGMTTTCTCVSADELPVEIPAYSSRTMNIKMRLKDSPTGLSEQTATFHTDHPADPSLSVKLSGRVTPH